MILVRPRISRHIRCLKFAIHAGLIFDGFSLFCDDRNELGMTFITGNS